MENMFDMWTKRELPVEWQRKVDAFAGQGTFHDQEEREQIWNFRAGFFIGEHIAEILRDLEK
ncbi:MAG: hypothetical protein II276_03820 [Bacteroidales bacterium]|nr:hypothetical protein [Bacteroidales bacterium]